MVKRRRGKKAEHARRSRAAKIAARRGRRLVELRKAAARSRKISAGLRAHARKVKDVQRSFQGMTYREAQMWLSARRAIESNFFDTVESPNAILVPRNETEEIAYNLEDVIRRDYPEVLAKLNAINYRVDVVAYESEGIDQPAEGETVVERSLRFSARERTPEAFFAAYFEAWREFRDQLKADYPGVKYWVFAVRGVYYD